MLPANSPVPNSGPGTDAKPSGRPIPGSFFDDRMPQGPGCSRGPKLAPLSSPSVPSPLLFTLRPQRAFLRHGRIFQSDVGKTTSEPEPRSHRLPPMAPDPGLRARREDRTLPIVLMSSDRLFLDGLLASIARLRFTGTINLPCSFRMATPNRTFLLCQKADISILP